MKLKAIGVIGGMGPEASQHFYGLLIRHAQKMFHVTQAEDFPEIFIASLPVPDIIEDEDNRKDAVVLLQDRIKRMQHLPIRFFCMACNTGHLLLDDLQEVTNVPFVSLLEEVPREIASSNIKRIGILATPTTIRTGMYEALLTKKKIHVILPTNTEIEILGKIVKDTIAGQHKDKNSRFLDGIAKGLVKKGAEGILLGCTEFPLIFQALPGIVTFDTLDILAKAVLREFFCYNREVI